MLGGTTGQAHGRIDGQMHVRTGPLTERQTIGRTDERTYGLIGMAVVMLRERSLLVGAWVLRDNDGQYV